MTMEKLPTYDYFKEYLTPGATVLDYGCSQGNLLRSSRGAISEKSYVGVDVDCFAIEKAKYEFPDAKFVDSTRKDFVHNPHGFGVFPDLKARTFDFILSYNVFAHADVADLKETVAWMARHLKTGGCIIASVCDINNAKCTAWFRKRRAEDYGFCEEILTDQPYVYLVESHAQVVPPTAPCRHFVSFVNLEWLADHLSAFNLSVGVPPSGSWIQTPIIISRKEST